MYLNIYLLSQLGSKYNAREWYDKINRVII